MIEPILNPENNRLTIFPIKYQEIWDEYKKQISIFWTAEEIDFSSDYEDFCTLSPDEQHYIKRILAFFAASDGIVNWNLSDRFLQDVQIPEARVCYQYQISIENIHNETYSIMLDNLVKDPIEKNELFNASKTVPSVKKMSDWAIQWIESDKSFAHRLIAFAIIEGVFFSSAFCSIFWLKYTKGSSITNGSRQFLHGLITSNKLIATDEGRHTIFATILYKLLENKLSYNEVLEIFLPAIEISKEFARDSLPVKLLGMNQDLMMQYIEYVSDYLLSMLGYPKKFHCTNPFASMITIHLDSKNNFFEERVGKYQNAFVNNETANEKFSINEDF